MYPIQKKLIEPTAFIRLNAVSLQEIIDKNKEKSLETLKESGVTPTLQPAPTVANKQNWKDVVVCNVNSNDVFREHIKEISKAKKINIIVHERDNDYQIAFKAEKTVYFETDESVRLLGFDPENNHSRTAAQELLKSVMTNRDMSIATSRKVASKLGTDYVAAFDEGLVHILPNTRNGCYQLVVKISSNMGDTKRNELLKPFYFDKKFYVEGHFGPVFIGTNETVNLMGKNPNDMNSFKEAQDILTKMAEYSLYSQSQSG